MLLAAIFGQTFDPQDLAIIGLLIVLEGVLSIDNALVLGLLAKRLPKHLQKRALTYGLVGAFVFRVIAIATATYLLKWWWVKLLGGGYLLYVALKHFVFERGHGDGDHHEHLQVNAAGEPVLVDDATGRELTPEEAEARIHHRAPVASAAAAPTEPAGPGRRPLAKFWPTVFVIEMTDIAFAVDSILAAVAMVPTTDPTKTNPKLWVVITGGMLGVILMRFAAAIFIKLLDRFPRFETAAYLLVAVIGLKLVVDWYFNKRPPDAPADWHAPMDFHSLSSPAFWVFWVSMLACFAVGFIPKRRKKDAGDVERPADAPAAPTTQGEG